MDPHFSPRIAERLRDRGLKATRPRVLVYDTLHAAGGHRSVDDIVALLAARGEALPRMTVYNVVSDLALAGMILCADTGPGRALYEANTVWHHHYVCRSCGSVHDVPCVEGRKPCIEPPAGVPGEVDEAQVIFRGLCHDCSRKRRN